jgi:G3E family GTPase
MKLVQVAGWLGSGKTTLVVALGKGLSKNWKVAIVVNEIGAIPVDGKVIEEYGLTVTDIGGGCICCQVSGNMVRTIKALYDGPRPDIVILEPTGLAVPGSIMESIRTSAHEMDISMGPIIVLIDIPRAEKLLGYEGLKRLVTAQMVDADIIALSKVDMATEGELLAARSSVCTVNPRAEIIHLSTRSGEGVAALIQAVTEMRVKV